MRLDDVWVPVAPIADSFVVNIGELMARWTNDRWTSTLHRVQNPLSRPGQPSAVPSVLLSTQLRLGHRDGSDLCQCRHPVEISDDHLGSECDGQNRASFGVRT